MQAVIALAIGLSASIVCTGCIPNAMRIDRANHPKYQDQYVRFRETYYFRVYDYCRDVKGQQQIVADALYRFRMTGKAHPLTTRVRFESGTMPKSMIEPFGSTIEYDRDTGRFNYRSFEASQGDQHRKDQLQAARELIDFAANIVRTADGSDLTAEKAVESTSTASTSNPDTAATPTTTPATTTTPPAAAPTATPTDPPSGTSSQVPPASPSGNSKLKTKFSDGAEKLVTASLAAAQRYVVASAPPATPLSNDDDTQPDSQDPSPTDTSSSAPVASAPASSAGSPTAAAPGSAGAPSSQASAGKATSKPKPAATSQSSASGATKATSSPSDSSSSTDSGSDTEDDRVSQAACRQLHRGFQILGPEGWRVFDQDERLVVAMSSSGQPLINTLKELSGRILNSQPDTAATTGAYTLDELKVTRAEGNLSRVDVTDTDTLIKSLERTVKDLQDQAPSTATMPPSGAPTSPAGAAP